MKNDTPTAARLLFAIPFAVFGLLHFANPHAMVGVVPLPGGVFWVYFVGVALLAASLGLATGIAGRPAAIGLALLLFAFVLFVHLPAISNPQMRQAAMINLLKDLALCGGALTWASLLGRRESREWRAGPPAASGITHSAEAHTAS